MGLRAMGRKDRCLSFITVACLARLILGDETQDLTNANVIPDVLDGVDTSHGVQLKVTYGDVSVDSKGVRLTRAQTATAPSVEVTDLVGTLLSKLKLQESSLYTLIICDPDKDHLPILRTAAAFADAPSPAMPTNREFLHWLVANAPGGNLEKGMVVEPYANPTPPAGVHRYVASLFLQPGSNKINVPTPASRNRFNTKAFAQSHGLGDPVQAAYFTVAAPGFD